MLLEDFNYLAIIVAIVSSLAIGLVWYGPLFGKIWQNGAGMSDEEMERYNPLHVFGLSFALTLIMAIALYLFLPEQAGLISTLKTAVPIGIVLIVASFFITNVLGKRKKMLWLIDVGYITVMALFMSIIVGLLS